MDILGTLLTAAGGLRVRGRPRWRCTVRPAGGSLHRDSVWRMCPRVALPARGLPCAMARSWTRLDCALRERNYVRRAGALVRVRLRRGGGRRLPGAACGGPAATVRRLHKRPRQRAATMRNSAAKGLCQGDEERPHHLGSATGQSNWLCAGRRICPWYDHVYGSTDCLRVWGAEAGAFGGMAWCPSVSPSAACCSSLHRCHCVERFVCELILDKQHASGTRPV